MKHESELITAVNDGFRKWLTVEEVREYVEAERLRVPSKAPQLFVIGFNSRAGYVTLEISVIKMTRIVDETGKLVDVQLSVVNDNIDEPQDITVSFFQPGAHKEIQFCRIFKDAKDRDSYYDDIRYLSDLTHDYKRAMLEAMRRQFKSPDA